MHRIAFAAACLLLGSVSAMPIASADEKLRVLTTTTDLRDIVHAVGGDRVEVDCVTKGPEDAHYVRARPSLIRAAASADMLVVVGRDLEIGYESLLREDSRNGRIQRGRPGYVDASEGVPALEVPEGPVDRSMGDVHPSGNPHYLTDPVLAKKAAQTVAERLSEIDPEHASAHRERAEAFARKVDVAMWGEALLAKQPARRLEERLRRGELADFLKTRGLQSQLGGWAAKLLPYSGRRVISYHGLFVYLLDRFHLVETAKIEPKPGIDPTPRHILSVVRKMKADDARVVLFASFQPERTARRVADQGGGIAVKLAHMPGAIEGTDSYLKSVDLNIRRLTDALAQTRGD